MTDSPHWDSWDADVAAFNAQIIDQANAESKGDAEKGIGKGKGKDDKGKGKGDVVDDAEQGIGKGKDKDDKGKGKGDGVNDADKGIGKGQEGPKPLGWDGPYVNVVGRVYWIWRSKKPNGKPRAHRYYESDSD